MWCKDLILREAINCLLFRQWGKLGQLRAPFIPFLLSGILDK